MSTYSIKELEKLSGIKAHTIRIWEQRYGIVKPSRSETNIRSYSDEDLKKIINVSLLNHHGLKISKIADLTAEELGKKVVELIEQHPDDEIHIDQLITAMVDMDEARFEGILGRLTKRHGFEHTITAVVYPFLDKIGVLWQTGKVTPAQEHFISNLIRQKIIVAIDSLPRPSGKRGTAMLFLPDDELHELGLLFYHFIARKTGWQTCYLGQMVPFADVVSIAQSIKPRLLITSLTTSPSKETTRNYLSRLCQALPKSKILATGRAFREALPLKFPNLHPFTTISDLKSLLK